VGDWCGLFLASAGRASLALEDSAMHY
jgi:hypothetical protein